MLYAASLPKIAILLPGAFVEIERGRIALDNDTRASLTRMIRVSSNEAATEMLRRVGMGRLAAILRSPRYGLYDSRFNGGLWVGKEYGRAAAWRRDPLHQLSHGATAFQTARFYYLLEAGQLVSPALTRVMKEMSKPGWTGEFLLKGLSDRPQCRMFRKSGTWRHWHADSALISTPVTSTSRWPWPRLVGRRVDDPPHRIRSMRSSWRSQNGRIGWRFSIERWAKRLAVTGRVLRAGLVLVPVIHIALAEP